MVLDASEICGVIPEEEDQSGGKLQGDHKPEYFQYKDEGCMYAQSCLVCPFPRCLYDERGGRQRLIRKRRNKRINRLFKSGRKIKELALIFKVSERTIHRVLKKGRG